MTQIKYVLWKRFINSLVRPKRLAIFQACLIGLVAGLAAVLLGESISWFGGWRRTLAHWVPVYFALPIIGSLGGFLAGWLVDSFAPEARGSGMSEVKAVLAKVPMPLNLRIALVKLISATLVLASGMPLGKEGPTLQIGAALANELSRWFPTSPEHRRQLIAAGAGAGLAAAFDAPIAGMLFVVEELLQDFSGITLGTAILASFIGSIVARISGSHSLNLDLHLLAVHTSFSASEIPFYLLLGVLSGILSALFNRGILAGLSIYRRCFHVSLPWQIGVAGLINGISLSMLPIALRDHAGLRQILLTGEANWKLVAFMFCLQFLLILITSSSGAPGGLLVPSMTLGAALGYLVGTWEYHWLELGTAATYARVGMGAFFCGVARVPITGIIIVFEMTTDFNLVLPLMIASVTSYLVGELIEAGSLYDRLLEFRGIHLTKDAASQPLWTDLTAADVMQRQVETLSGQLSLEEALQKFAQSSHRGFPVMEKGKLVGILTQKDIARISQQGLTGNCVVANIMTPEPLTANPDDTLAHVLHLLNHYSLSSLPVSEGRRLVGIITRSDIIRVEAAHLGGEHNLALPQAAASHTIYQTRSPEIGQGRILVPLSNPKTAHILIEMAMAIARDRHYEIECLHVIVVPRHQHLKEATVSTTECLKLLRSAIQLTQTWRIPVHTEIRVAHNISSAILESIKQRHFNLVLMGWKSNTTTSGQTFSRAVDTIIRQATCSVVLVKLSNQPRFDRWLVPIAGGPNSQQVIQLLPILSTLSKAPEFNLCQVFELDQTELDTTTLEKASFFLKQHFNLAVTTTPIRASSISDAVLNYAQHHQSEVIILGASREGIWQQLLHNNIPAEISQTLDQTVILVRGNL